MVTNVAGIDGVRNPLPAAGGVDPETVEDVRRFAPEAFRTQERAVTADDYARRGRAPPAGPAAAATFRWTGSWRTVFVTVDRFAEEPRTRPCDPALPALLEPYRMAGHDLEVDAPRYVPLEIEMQVCVKRDYFRADVKRALLDVFSEPDARRRAAGASSIPTTSPSASRSTCRASTPRRTRSTAWSPCEGHAVPAPGHAGSDAARGRPARRSAGSRSRRLDNDPNLPERGVFRLERGRWQVS